MSDAWRDVQTAYDAIQQELARIAGGAGDGTSLMTWVYNLGLALSRYPALVDHPDRPALHRRSADALLGLPRFGWLEDFIDEIDDDLDHFEAYVDFYRWPSVPWSRSAVAFLVHLYREDRIREHISSSNIQALDDRIVHVREVMGIFVSEIPIGIPGRHWWWWDGPRGNLTGTKQGRYIAQDPRRSIFTQPPRHPLLLACLSED